MAACDRAISSGELTGRALALAHSNRGVEWTARGDLTRAIADYDQAIQHDPSQAAAFHNRGTARASKRDFDGAIADYAEAIRRNPKYGSAFGRRGLAHFSKGDLDRAISDYDQSIRTRRQAGPSPISWNSRCWTRAVIGQLQAALSDCNEALRLRLDFANALDSRGFVHLKSGRYDEAIVDYDAALRIDAKKFASLYGRGMAKRRKHDIASGNADIAAARALKPEISIDFSRYGVSPPLPDMQPAK